MRRIVLGVAIIVTIAVFSTSVWFMVGKRSERNVVVAPGVINAPDDTGGPFELTSHQGAVTTEKAFKGKYVLVFFGYSFCPDVCPTGLQNVANALDKLGKDKRDQVTPIFISVDPERDTPEQLAQYVTLFHPNLVGLTGTEAQVKSVTKRFRVYYKLRKDEDPENYPVDHSAFTYLMDPNWKLALVFSHSATPDAIASAIEKLM